MSKRVLKSGTTTYKKFSWDFENRLTSVATYNAGVLASTTNFYYDQNGERVKKETKVGTIMIEKRKVD